MPHRPRTLGATLALALLSAAPLLAQTPAKQPDVMVATMQAGATHIKSMFTIAADSMSEADYAFKPTPEVRSFGQLLAHVAESNYSFCAGALGETSPGDGIEKTKTTRSEIRQALAESQAYCDRAFAAMHDTKNTMVMRPFRRTQLPALAVLNFRNYHALLHWGNAITYMRLRGKVPPTAA
jgi:uncharacterized damage-inducible protein DinB